MNCEIYLYGMILATTSFLLSGDYPAADTYGEIQKRYRLPGGETGTSATVLSGLGASCRIDGTHMGRLVYPVIEDYYKDKTVDITPLHRIDDWDGLEDYVIIDKHTRTPFGTFGSYFSSGENRWSVPRGEDIDGTIAAGIDPYFGEQSIAAARLCAERGVPYVTIDCAPDSEMHRLAAITAISSEYYHDRCDSHESIEALLHEFMAGGEGLCIITRGSRELYYGRRGGEIHSFMPYSVDVVSTLGAGDTFKAGCIWALAHGMSDFETVRFASALAGVVCTRFPIPLNRPTLADVDALIASRAD